MIFKISKYNMCFPAPAPLEKLGHFVCAFELSLTFHHICFPINRVLIFYHPPPNWCIFRETGKEAVGKINDTGDSKLMQNLYELSSKDLVRGFFNEVLTLDGWVGFIMLFPTSET